MKEDLKFFVILCFLELIPQPLKQDNHESLQENDRNLLLNAEHTSNTKPENTLQST